MFFVVVSLAKIRRITIDRAWSIIQKYGTCSAKRSMALTMVLPRIAFDCRFDYDQETQAAVVPGKWGR